MQAHLRLHTSSAMPSQAALMLALCAGKALCQRTGAYTNSHSSSTSRRASRYSRHILHSTHQGCTPASSLFDLAPAAPRVACCCLSPTTCMLSALNLPSTSARLAVEVSVSSSAGPSSAPLHTGNSLLSVSHTRVGMFTEAKHRMPHVHVHGYSSHPHHSVHNHSHIVSMGSLPNGKGERTVGAEGGLGQGLGLSPLTDLP